MERGGWGKRVGDFIFPAVSFGLEQKWGMMGGLACVQLSSSHVEAVRFSMLPFHTYGNAAHRFCCWVGGGAEIHTEANEEECYLPFFTAVVVASNKHTGKRPPVITTAQHICATFTRLALLSLWNHF